MTKYFLYKPRFNGAFLKHNLLRMKDEAHVINLDDKKIKEKHWVLIIKRITRSFSRVVNN